MALPAKTADRTLVARDRLAEIVGRHLLAPPLAAAEAVREIMELTAEVGHVRVGCRDDGQALTIRHGCEPAREVDLPRARGFLRSMCANLAVRSALPDQAPSIFGGVTFLPPLQADGPGFTLKMMNTMDEHWFDLTPQGETT